MTISKTIPSEPTGQLPTEAEMLRVINNMVSEGKLELCIIDGKPGVRLIKEKVK